MSPTDQALQILTGIFRTVFAAFLSFFGLVENVLRHLMEQTGVPQRLHGTIILVAAVLFIVIVARLFGGFFRILLVLFLLLLILHVLAPLLGI
ncbi:hypothetical protein [Acidisphaera sp. L21]|uniref:hypothetical protein n=1 Tax=Acidisphaera sp. L21 TaxID=1641851 RepID=UPI00131D66B3|nr:hypothetical protein [Acidisphaera sp. L21]